MGNFSEIEPSYKRRPDKIGEALGNGSPQSSGRTWIILCGEIYPKEQVSEMTAQQARVRVIATGGSIAGIGPAHLPNASIPPSAATNQSGKQSGEIDSLGMREE